MSSKTIVMDLDGTLCSQERTGTYHLAKPKTEVIRKVNLLWTEGYKIVIFTARGMSACSGNVEFIEENYREMTETWLKDNRVCYDELRFGKEDAMYFVDDKGLTPKEFVNTEFE